MKAITVLQLSVVAPVIAGVIGCASNHTTTKTFATPEDAMHEVASIAGTGNIARAEQIFGSEGVQLLDSGDEVADREDATRIKEAIEAQLTFADDGPNTKFALIGPEEWPFPIPLVADHGRWRFDTDAGREEVRSRCIGQNELMTLATLHECVYAQQEYCAQSRDGKAPCYACKIASADGHHDGLFWNEPDASTDSPLGPLVAAADCEDGHNDKAATPYHGYFYRCLSCQGKHAPGGEKNFVDDHGLPTNGFALLAWPANYGESGVMTFQINHRGIIYQKDLGKNTEANAAKITSFDPDEGWDPTGD